MLKNKYTIGFVSTFAVAAAFLLVFVTAPSSKAVSESSADEGSNAVLHLSKARNISLEEAKMRIGWQDKSDALDAKLIKELPEADYGGMWIDRDTDRVKIGVLNETKNDGSKRSELNQKTFASELTEAVDYVEVQHSYSELLKTKEMLSKLFDERVGSVEWPMQFGLMPSQNKIEISIPKDQAKIAGEYKVLLDEFKAKYSDMIVYDVYTGKPTMDAECNWWFCNSPLRGAVGLKGSFNGYIGTICTAGFNVVGNSGTKYVVTAGHCELGGTGWATETYNYTHKPIGPVHDNLMDNSGTSKLDAMIIKIREDTYDWDVMGKILVRSGTIGMDGVDPPSYNEQYDITDSAANGGLEGARICVSGAKSTEEWYGGGSCGTINLVDTDWFACDSEGNNCARTYKLTRASYCAVLGDSGMPVFRLGKAHGVHRGGDSGFGQCSGRKYFTGMNPIISGFGGNISIF